MGPVVIGCSALKRAYRDNIRDNACESVCFLHLEGSRETLSERMAKHSGHYARFAARKPVGHARVAGSG